MSTLRQGTGSPLPHVMQTRKATTWEQFIQTPERQKSFPSFAATSPQLSAALGFSANMNSGSPFVSSPHGHPGFTPAKVPGRSSVATDGRNQKAPKPPDKPLMPYMRYSRKVWEHVRLQNPDLKVYEIGKVIGQQWRDLPIDKKQEFADEFEVEKAEYNQLLRSYHESPAFQSWMQNKERDGHIDKQSKKKLQDGKVTLQSVDDDEDVEEFSQKHVASARYLRNHRLVNDIFSDALVPDVRSVVMTNRMQVLKRQVQSLTNHQKKLEAELTQIEEKFEAKKRRFLDASEVFQREMKERCEAKLIDAPKYQKMIDKAVEEITAEMEKARQVREEQMRVQRLEEAKREAEAAALAASQPHPEAQSTDTTAAILTDVSDQSLPAAQSVPESGVRQLIPQSEAMDDPTTAPDLVARPNPPDIAGNDSLTNDSSATVCSASQESLPPDAPASHDPAMDEDTDPGDVADESMEVVPEEPLHKEADLIPQLLPQLPVQTPAPPDSLISEFTESVDACNSDVSPPAQVVDGLAMETIDRQSICETSPHPEVAGIQKPVPPQPVESEAEKQVAPEPEIEIKSTAEVPSSTLPDALQQTPDVVEERPEQVSLKETVLPVTDVAVEDIPLPPVPQSVPALNNPSCLRRTPPADLVTTPQAPLTVELASQTAEPETADSVTEPTADSTTLTSAKEEDAPTTAVSGQPEEPVVDVAVSGDYVPATAGDAQTDV